MKATSQQLGPNEIAGICASLSELAATWTLLGELLGETLVLKMLLAFLSSNAFMLAREVTNQNP